MIGNSCVSCGETKSLSERFVAEPCPCFERKKKYVCMLALMESSVNGNFVFACEAVLRTGKNILET